jgi:hypothetical protein
MCSRMGLFIYNNDTISSKIPFLMTGHLGVYDNQFTGHISWWNDIISNKNYLI